MTETTELTGIPERNLSRIATIKPRRSGYCHRDIIVISDCIGYTETFTPVRHLPMFVASMPAHVWVTLDPSWLLGHLTDYYEYCPQWTYQLVEATKGQLSRSRVVRFGLRPEGKGKGALHTVWAPFDMLSDPTKTLAGGDTKAVMTWALDFRDWLQHADLPIPTSLAGIGNALLRDKRFYPNDRGRVPAATNERIREFLPGVYQDLRAPVHRTYTATALDQRGAYHAIAQTIPLPESDTLYARGFFSEPEDAPVWLTSSDPGFEEVLAAPGLVCVEAISRITRTNEFRPPTVNYSGSERIYLWTNEIPFLRARDVTITGIYAAWVAEAPDKGLPKYATWAQTEIRAAPKTRARWLKPALHTTYGLLAARPRTMRFGWRHGTSGEPSKWNIGVRQFFVRESQLEHKPPLANVAQLGMLQAEVRQRTLLMAEFLEQHGATVTHIHADGLHVTGPLPIIDNSWSIEDRTRLTYLDRVSWTADQGSVLPGRDRSKTILPAKVERARELERHRETGRNLPF